MFIKNSKKTANKQNRLLKGGFAVNLFILFVFIVKEFFIYASLNYYVIQYSS